MGWFLCDGDFRQERVKTLSNINNGAFLKKQLNNKKAKNKNS